MRFTRKECNKLCDEFEQITIDNRLKPVVYTGMQNQKTVIVFNNYFGHETITRLINDIESVRQVGGYSVIDLFFTSDGGSADSMFMLADYLNNLEGIKINIIVTGMVASAGFYILLLIDNADINIIFNKCCSGLIHLGDNLISYRGQLAPENSRYNYDKFVSDHLEKLNEFFKNDILPKLNLSKKDLKHINEGKDLMLHGDELEKIINEYHENKYFNSDESIENYTELHQKLSDCAILIGNFKDKFKQYTSKDIDKELGIEYIDKEEVEYIDDNRGSGK